MYLKRGSHFSTLLDIGCGLEVNPDVDSMGSRLCDYLYNAKRVCVKQRNKDKKLERNKGIENTGKGLKS